MSHAMTTARQRHATLARILAVQATKRSLEQWKQADFSRRVRETAAAEAALIETLDAEGALANLFPEQSARRLETLSRRRRSLEDALARQEEAVRVEARREKAAEVLVADAARKAEEERRRRADLEVLEAYLARDAEAASLA